MKKLLALSLVFVAVLGFDLVICKYKIRTLETEIHQKDSIIQRCDSIMTVGMN